MDPAPEDDSSEAASQVGFSEPGDPMSPAAPGRSALDEHTAAAERTQRRGVPADTTREAARVQRAALAARSPEERVDMVFEMSAMMRQRVLDGIQRRHPDITPEELQLRLIERLHGRSVASAVATSLEGQVGA